MEMLWLDYYKDNNWNRRKHNKGIDVEGEDTGWSFPFHARKDENWKSLLNQKLNLTNLSDDIDDEQLKELFSVITIPSHVIDTRGYNGFNIPYAPKLYVMQQLVEPLIKQKMVEIIRHEDNHYLVRARKRNPQQEESKDPAQADKVIRPIVDVSEMGDEVGVHDMLEKRPEQAQEDTVHSSEQEVQRELYFVREALKTLKL